MGNNDDCDKWGSVRSVLPACRPERAHSGCFAGRCAPKRCRGVAAPCGVGGGIPDKEGRRRWTFEELLTEAETVARALLLRFKPGEHVAIWSSNVPEWVLMEFGAALAGLTLVTVNPAYLGAELAFVLKKSRACGIVVQDTYRNRDLVATVNEVRATLPSLREVIPLSALWRPGSHRLNCRRSGRATLPRSNTHRERRARPRERASRIGIWPTTAGFTRAR